MFTMEPGCGLELQNLLENIKYLTGFHSLCYWVHSDECNIHSILIILFQLLIQI